MLVEFSVANYRSLKEIQTLSLLATNVKEHPENTFQPSTNEDIRLLKTAVIYGANASGKSNLLAALGSFFILLTTEYNVGDTIKLYEPFLFTENQKIPTTFEIEFFGFDKIRYKYLVSFSDTSIIKETLYFYPKNQETKLFTRIGSKISYGDSLKGNKKIIENQLLDNQLFLSKAAKNKNDHLGLVYLRLLSVTHLSTDVNGFIEYSNDTISKGTNQKGKHFLSKLLKVADTGIDKLEFIQKNDKQGFLPVFEHGVYDAKNQLINKVYLSLGKESEGTRKLYGLGGLIFELLKKETDPSTIFLDEFNNSFHPLISEMIIKLYHQIETNENNSQFIFTTHDPSLLSADLFRRDQIWFTEKDEFGATSLFSLAEFEFDKVRANIPFDKWYLSGRFGGLPLIKDFEYPTNAKTKGSKKKV